MSPSRADRLRRLPLSAAFRARGLAGRAARLAALRRETLRRWADRLRGRRAPRRHLTVCGVPRSGTSLLYNMLCATLDGFAFDRGERVTSSMLWRYEDRASKSPADVFRARDFERHNMHRKTIAMIVTVRDVRDVVTSRHPWAPDRYLIGYEGGYHFHGPAREREVYWDASRGLEAYFTQIEALRRAPPCTLCLVRYEDLARDPAAVQARLGRDLDLCFHGAFGDYHTRPETHAIRYASTSSHQDGAPGAAGGPVSTTRIGRWRLPEHRARIRDQFTRFPALFDLLAAYGYETDTDWFAPYREAGPNRSRA